MQPSVTLLGRTTPRLWTPPLVRGRKGPCGCGCALTAKTSLGFSAVRFADEVLGVTLFPWQRWLLIHALELRRDGRFRFRTVLVMVARQNGKTSLVEIKNLWKMFVLRVRLVINTAQNLDVSEESWDNAVAMVESIPELAEEMAGDPIQRNGKKTLRLVGGSRWKVATASRKGGRGLSGDDVNLDELREHQTWDAWGAVTKTTLGVGRPPGRQTWAYSNAGDEKSVVLNDLQEKGRAAVNDPETADSSLGYFEWSAPDDCAIDDETLWPLANPSIGYDGGIDVEGLRAALRTDPPAVFRTECLCQRVKKLAPPPISEAAWRARAGAEGRPDNPVAFAVSAAWPNAEHGCIAVAGRRGGELLVQVVDYRPGTSWIPGRLAELRDQWQPCAAVLNDKDPAAREKPAIEAAGVDLVTLSMVELGQAYGMFHAEVCGDGPTLRHYSQPELDRAVEHAGTRPLGDALTWDRRGPVDISPLVAVTNAAYGLATKGSSGQFFMARR